MLKTMTLLALVMLTSAAPAEETTDNARSLGWTSSYSRTPTLTAEWKQSDQGNFKATVKAEETAPGQATWKVELEPRYWYSHFEPLKTEGGEVCVALNWHLHQDEIGNEKPGGKTPENCGTTGGHVDTALACGSASEYRKTSCTGFSADYLNSYGADVKNADDVVTYPQRCKGDDGKSIVKNDDDEFTTVGQAGCEYGDMSGKIGKIPNKVGSKTFPIDKHILPLSSYAENSVVFHCCTKKDPQNNGHPASSCNCEGDVCSNCDLTCKPRVACQDLSYRR